MQNGNLEEDLANAVQDLYGEPTIYESEEEWLYAISKLTTWCGHKGIVKDQTTTHGFLLFFDMRG